MARSKAPSISPALVRASNMIAAKAADLRADGEPDLADGLDLAHGIIFRATIEEATAPAAGGSADGSEDPEGVE